MVALAMKSNTNYTQVRLSLPPVMKNIIMHLAKARGVSTSRLLEDVINDPKALKPKKIKIRKGD